MKRVLTITLFATLVSGSLKAQNHFEYLTIMKTGHYLYVSTGAETYEEVNIKDELKHKHFDLTPVNKRVAAYEANGWEFVSSDTDWTGQQASFLTYTVTLKRKK